MKRCDACGEVFPDHFSFCAIDGKPLEAIYLKTSKYHPTLLSERSLAERLAAEAHFLFDNLQRGWPQFKAHPVAFVRTEFSRLQKNTRLLLARPYVVGSSLTAIMLVFVLALTIVLFDRRARDNALASEPDEDLVPTVTIDLRTQEKPDSGKGVGQGSNGRVGFNNGRGEGSGPKPARAQGGGGGGNLSPLPSSVGRLPQPSVIPAPIPTTYARVAQSLPEAGLDIDPVLYKDLPFRDYGDPTSKSVVTSNGPGKGGGIGTNQGQGIGAGDGSGFGPGNKRNVGGGDPNDGCCGSGGSSDKKPNNDIDRVFRAPEVTTRARVLSKPEPQYTEEARRGGTTGTVTLSVVFSRTGQVTNIRAVQTLCCGLTEKAIAAARQIRFVPATRDGRAVSMYMQLEYNFNLY
jgi:TonB family protein